MVLAAGYGTRLGELGRARPKPMLPVCGAPLVRWAVLWLRHHGIREIAINDLRRITGEYFGYHHDLPRKERELAADRWASWWRETGMRRFVLREDERNRPTALLPARRE